MIIRPDYIQAVTPFIDQPLVKILAGVRRCGKSTIFEMLADELRRRGVPEDRIIKKRYTEMDIPADISAKDMYDDLKLQIQGKGRCYLLLDEIQEVKGWEKTVNSLLEGADVDIYVTGSNSKLMSSEISTYLTGRYVSIPVYPLSFREFLDFKAGDPRPPKELLEDFIRFGGFPIIALGKYDRNEHRTVSVESIYNYLRWLEQAFIIYPCHRYDIQGKAVLATQEKYYLADVTLKYCLLGYDRKMLDGALENIVFLELKRRGYEVYIGKNAAKEIDFIGIRRDEKIYVQVCVQLPENSDREIGNLMEIQDHYPKYVVTTNSLDVGNENGIRIVHLADFLLDEQW